MASEARHLQARSGTHSMCMLLVKLCLRKRDVEILTPRTSECVVIWKYSLY